MDFIVKSENYGIPQARHRVILLGVREDIAEMRSPEDILCIQEQQAKVRQAIADLPRLRSGLSRGDTPEAWLNTIKGIAQTRWFKEQKPDMRDCLQRILSKICLPKKNRGSEFVECDCQPEILQHWFFDQKLKGACNHSTRGYLSSDLHRYIFAACFASVCGKSPVLSDFPEELLPEHRNVEKALKGALFEDRFRVQLYNKPSTTVVSHISKDGHYYIHYDASQCRSLTVREAARLQTFPDNYFFCGPRTSQYQQVGNAVPPYLAYQIAEVVLAILERAGRANG
jgi:DNA (cytosine-5)-methyltransferase 1